MIKNSIDVNGAIEFWRELCVVRCVLNCGWMDFSIDLLNRSLNYISERKKKMSFKFQQAKSVNISIKIHD